MDTLVISALSVETQIGVFAWEQRIKQKLLIDLTLPRDFSACQDTLADTVDYDALCQTVTQYVEGKAFQLIETVANEVAQLVVQEFKVKEVSVAVSKPHAVKNAGNIKVVVTRS